ncbi:MAG TPA: ArsR family transcriptional regulator [Phycisphaerales bacterium]|nr:ArsR family transcriptional regulator [Phycisphaerales bacterium]|tara:strand:+ start:4175 stop:4561 length:387 start_codon:yes stop_codon:yes gene_type:complete
MMKGLILQLTPITKAMADESRLRVLSALSLGELCLCQIVALLELAPSTVSRHMGVLVGAELVVTRKAGKWTYYTLNNTRQPGIIKHTLKWLEKVREDDPVWLADQKKLAVICEQDPSELCEITYGKSE